MVEVKYITGDTETFEIRGMSPWIYRKDFGVYVIFAVGGNVEIPKESILRISHIVV